MVPASAPTEQEIRLGLIRRAEEFSRHTGISKSEIGKRAVNDPAVLRRISEGRNFTINLYRRLMQWLDSNWPQSKMQRSATRDKASDISKAKLDMSNANDGENALGRSRAAAERHFSRFKHLRTGYFRTAAEIEAHVNKLRDEWTHR